MNDQERQAAADLAQGMKADMERIGELERQRDRLLYVCIDLAELAFGEQEDEEEIDKAFAKGSGASVIAARAREIIRECESKKGKDDGSE